MLVVRISEAVDHCHYFLVFLTGFFSDFYLERIDSLALESTRALTSRVLDCLYCLPAGMTGLTKITGLKCTCLSFLLGLVCLSLLFSFHRVFNRRE